MANYLDLIKEKEFLDVHNRSAVIEGAGIVSICQSDAIITFSIQGLTDVYTQYIKINNMAGVNTSCYTLDELTEIVLTSDLEVACTCPAFLYWGFQYISAIESYGLWDETAFPEIRNPELQGNVCKHLYKILSNWAQFAPQIAALFPYQQNSLVIKKSNMKKKKILFQAKAKLAKMLNLEFESVETSDGKTLYVDGEIVAGAAIYELTNSGEYVPAADGTYTADEMTIVVNGGMVVSVNAEEEFAPEEQSDLLEIVNEILNILKEQKEEINSLQEEVVELSTELRKATGTSKGKQVSKNSFNRRTKEINFADQKMNNLIKNFK